MLRIVEPSLVVNGRWRSIWRIVMVG